MDPQATLTSSVTSSDDHLIKRQLIDSPLVQSHAGRELLKYMIDCALPQEVELSAQVGNQTYSFRGGAGIAPDWLERGLNSEQERWVSACMLARVNYYGKKVKISMRPFKRGRDNIPEFLQTTPEEEGHYTLFEGAFFGNLFQASPSAFACQGDGHPSLSAAMKDRVCTVASGQTTPTGESVSVCGFIIKGSCYELLETSLQEDYLTQAIAVYLKQDNREM